MLYLVVFAALSALGYYRRKKMEEKLQPILEDRASRPQIGNTPVFETEEEGQNSWNEYRRYSNKKFWGTFIMLFFGGAFLFALIFWWTGNL